MPCIVFFAAAGTQDEPLPADALRPVLRDNSGGAALAGQGPGDAHAPAQCDGIAAGSDAATSGTSVSGKPNNPMHYPSHTRVDGNGNGGGDGNGNGGGGGGDGDKGTGSVAGNAASPARSPGLQRAQPCRVCAEKDALVQTLRAQIAALQRGVEAQAVDAAVQVRTHQSELQSRDSAADRLLRQAAELAAVKQDALLAEVDALQKTIHDRDQALVALRARAAQADETVCVRVCECVRVSVCV